MGPTTLVSSKSRIGFMTRVRFTGVQVKRDSVRAGFWLRRRAESPRFARVEYIQPGNWLCYIDLRSPADVDDEIVALIRESRLIGDQRHHTPYQPKG